jgi:hypothetical protein
MSGYVSAVDAIKNNVCYGIWKRNSRTANLRASIEFQGIGGFDFKEKCGRHGRCGAGSRAFINVFGFVANYLHLPIYQCFFAHFNALSAADQRSTGQGSTTRRANNNRCDSHCACASTRYKRIRSSKRAISSCHYMIPTPSE